MSEEKAFYDAVLDHPDVQKMTACNPLAIARIAEEIHVKRLKDAEYSAYDKAVVVVLERRDKVTQFLKMPDQSKAYQALSRVMSSLLVLRDEVRR